MNRLVIANHYCWFALFIVLLSGCMHQSRVKHYLSKSASEELRARSFDVLIPTNAILLQNESPLSTDEARAQLIIAYTIKSDFESLRSVYQSEMERLGWLCLVEFVPSNQQEQQSNASCAALVYKKPEALCCVIIEQRDAHSFAVRCMRSTLA